MRIDETECPHSVLCATHCAKRNTLPQMQHIGRVNVPNIGEGQHIGRANVPNIAEAQQVQEENFTKSTALRLRLRRFAQERAKGGQ
jgi:hypothetical protein